MEVLKGTCSTAAILTMILVAQAQPAPGKCFVVRVVDDQTGRGVPMVELKSLHGVVFVTDSAGIACIDDPVLMGRKVAFSVKSHGYEFQQNIYDEPGVILTLTPGGVERLKIHRVNIAERLYRITGAGIYQDSVLAGIPAPIQQPLLNGGVVGQDTVSAAVYRDRIFWIWGDTLGLASINLSVSGATSALPGRGGLDPSVGIDLRYVLDEAGFSRPMLPLRGKGLVWIEGLLTVHDPEGQDRLLATYTRQDGLKPPDECGVALFNAAKEIFEKWAARPCLFNNHLSSQPFLHSEGGREYWYLYPVERVPNEWDALRDPKRWEAFTCLKVGADPKQPQFDRGPNGSVLCGWKAGAARLDAAQERDLIARKLLPAAQQRFPLQDAATGQPSRASVSCTVWNEYRKRWILLAERTGDVFYSEADRPEGPWRKAIRIVHHDNYNFYNVVTHAFFNQEGGRAIYFEGTYTDSFANKPQITPRYNYNQVMYRLRLDDPRLKAVQ